MISLSPVPFQGSISSRDVLHGNALLYQEPFRGDSVEGDLVQYAEGYLFLHGGVLVSGGELVIENLYGAVPPVYPVDLSRDGDRLGPHVDKDVGSALEAEFHLEPFGRKVGGRFLFPREVVGNCLREVSRGYFPQTRESCRIVSAELFDGEAHGFSNGFDGCVTCLFPMEDIEGPVHDDPHFPPSQGKDFFRLGMGLELETVAKVCPVGAVDIVLEKGVIQFSFRDLQCRCAFRVGRETLSPVPPGERGCCPSHGSSGGGGKCGLGPAAGNLHQRSDEQLSLRWFPRDPEPLAELPREFDHAISHRVPAEAGEEDIGASEPVDEIS